LKVVGVRVIGGLLLATLVACGGNRSNDPAPTDTDEEPVETVAATPVATEYATIVAAPPLPTKPEPRVIVVTLDGVRWEDMLGATSETSTLAMPNLHRLVNERGVVFGAAGCEHEVRAYGPSYVSLPGYLEIFTGKPTACTHNYCANVDSDTFVDEVRDASKHDTDVAVFSSWNRYSAAAAHDRKSIVMSAGARTIGIAPAKEDRRLKALLDQGAATAGYPGYGDYRPDATTSKIALRYLEIEKPRLLVIGLGDADEQAHRGDIPGYRRAILKSDDMIGEIDKTLRRMGEVDRTTVIVTTDHGRAKSLFSHGPTSPESGRVWIAAFGGVVAHRGVACAPEELRLTHVAGAVRYLLSVDSPLETGPLAEALVHTEPGIR
jgi:hypothetical protein